MDVKGNRGWNRARSFLYRKPTEHTRSTSNCASPASKILRSASAFFRNAVLYKLDSAPTGAMVLDIDADTRLMGGKSVDTGSDLAVIDCRSDYRMENGWRHANYRSWVSGSPRKIPGLFDVRVRTGVFGLPNSFAYCNGATLGRE